MLPFFMFITAKERSPSLSKDLVSCICVLTGQYVDSKAVTQTLLKGSTDTGHYHADNWNKINCLNRALGRATLSCGTSRSGRSCISESAYMMPLTSAIVTGAASIGGNANHMATWWAMWIYICLELIRQDMPYFKVSNKVST